MLNIFHINDTFLVSLPVYVLMNFFPQKWRNSFLGILIKLFMLNLFFILWLLNFEAPFTLIFMLKPFFLIVPFPSKMGKILFWGARTDKTFYDESFLFNGFWVLMPPSHWYFGWNSFLKKCLFPHKWGKFFYYGGSCP